MKALTIACALCAMLFFLPACNDVLVAPHPVEESNRHKTDTPVQGNTLAVESGGNLLQLSIEDPQNDHTGSIDVARMEMKFDNTTGNYTISLIANRANLFQGNFRVNINLFNLDVGTSAQDPGFFQDNVNDFSLASPLRKITLTGTDIRLTAWNAGDQVSTNSLEGTPNPDGTTLFRSSVLDLPISGFLTDEDVIAFAETAHPARIRQIKPPPRPTTPEPDLIISAAGVTSFSEDRIDYCYDVMNIGDAPANLDGPTDIDGDNVSVQAFLSNDEIFNNAGDQPAGGSILGASPLGELDPGETISDCFGATVSNPDDYVYLTLKADWGEVVEESDEDNNTIAVLVQD